MRPHIKKLISYLFISIKHLKGVIMSQKYSRLVIAFLPEILELIKFSDMNYELLKSFMTKNNFRTMIF